jgi:hypothetical protein
MATVNMLVVMMTIGDGKARGHYFSVFSGCDI